MKLRFTVCLPRALAWPRVFTICAILFTVASAPAETRWWKGNLHTHTLWSDGDDFPESVTAWYKDHGYHFLALSDHNILLRGEKWIPVGRNKARESTFRQYRDRFGESWVEHRMLQETQMVRLRPLNEFRKLFEEPGRFLLIPSEEISDSSKSLPLHLNATNLRDFIKPQRGTNVLDTLQRNVDAVLAQRARLRRPMFPHINHPNFGWAIRTEELMQVRGDKFFEIYNGHPHVHNEGRTNRLGTEQMWDFALTYRLNTPGLGILYGLAVDDAHNYHNMTNTSSNPGRGWLMVQAPRLTVPHLVRSLEAGNFYASTGVTLKDFRRNGRQLKVEVLTQPGVTYRIQFIGTEKAIKAGDVEASIHLVEQGTPQTAAEIGTVLSETEGPSATYTLTGDELYVRVKVISSRLKPNPYRPGEFEVAWVQPWVP